MASQINLLRGSIIRKCFIGFSWTVLFFGFFVPLFRGDWAWSLVMLLVGILTGGIANIIFAFTYNKNYTRKLLERGFLPVERQSRNLLITEGIIVTNYDG